MEGVEGVGNPHGVYAGSQISGSLFLGTVAGARELVHWGDRPPPEDGDLKFPSVGILITISHFLSWMLGGSFGLVIESWRMKRCVLQHYQGQTNGSQRIRKRRDLKKQGEDRGE